MCGIGGIFGSNLSPADSERRLELLSERLAHRGPDDAGKFMDPYAAIGLIHRRLSILDLSPAGHQPMESPDGRYVIAFNGEIYNFESLRTSLGDTGFEYRGSSDTEVLLQALMQWGIGGALERAVGMFAFALWDRQARVLYLTRDRLGEKPLTLAKLDRGFAFCSEVSALRTAGLVDTTVDRSALALYLKYAYVPAPHGIYSGTRKIMPGTVVAISAKDASGSPHDWPVIDTHDEFLVREHRYWDARAIAEETADDYERLSPAGLEAEFLERIEAAVRLQLRADVPVGAFLSGGIDSSLVCAVAQSVSPRPLKTFTMGFSDKLFDESGYAAAIASHLGTDHECVEVTPQDVLDTVPTLAHLSDEPFADPSQLPTFMVSRIARRHITVCLTGDGGDELFGGYNRYIEPMRLNRRTRHLPRFLSATVAAGLKLVPARSVDRVFAMLAGSLGQSRFHVQSPGRKLHKLADVLNTPEPGDQYELLMTHWRDPNELLTAHSHVPEIDTGLEWQWETFAEQAMLWDIAHYLPDNNLAKVDRASMAVSLETRLPLLDHRIVEFALKIPLEAKIDQGIGKRILRRTLRRFVPDDLIERPKMGFSVPIATWLRGPLREWADDLLAPETTSRIGMFDPAPIQKCWREHASGRADHYLRLWLVLQAHAWYLQAQGELAQAAGCE